MKDKTIPPLKIIGVTGDEEGKANSKGNMDDISNIHY